MNTKNKDEKPLFVLAEYKNPKYSLEKYLGVDCIDVLPNVNLMTLGQPLFLFCLVIQSIRMTSTITNKVTRFTVNRK